MLKFRFDFLLRGNGAVWSDTATQSRPRLCRSWRDFHFGSVPLCCKRTAVTDRLMSIFDNCLHLTINEL
jgi:hypothetical protein